MKQEFFRIWLRSATSRWRGRAIRAGLTVLAGAVLAGCAASWRAPVETRGGRAVAPPPVPISADEYRVQRGDTLYAIAWQRGVDYRVMAAWNGIRPPYRIYPGQTLRLKPPPVPRTPPAQPPPVASRAKPRPAYVPPPTAQTPAATVSAPRPAVTPEPPSGSQRLTWRWPVEGRIISGFKANDPLRKGVKFTGRSGDPIRSAEGGRVVYSGSGLIGYGRLIIVKHNDKYLSAYGHNREILVKEGDQVTKGQKIAEMGTANNGEPLLHFEIRKDGEPVDPLRLLPPR